MHNNESYLAGTIDSKYDVDYYSFSYPQKSFYSKMGISCLLYTSRAFRVSKAKKATRVTKASRAFRVSKVKRATRVTKDVYKRQHPHSFVLIHICKVVVALCLHHHGDGHIIQQSAAKLRCSM